MGFGIPTMTLSANFLGKDNAGVTHEPQRTSLGMIYVKFSSINLNTILEEKTLNSEVILAMAIDSCSLPGYGVEVVTMGWFLETIKFPGKAIVDDTNWVLRDFVVSEVADVLDAWWAMTFNPLSGGGAKAADYKQDAFVLLFDTDGVNTSSRKRWYRMEGCYPSRVERGDLDHTGGDYVRITVTLKADRVVPLYLIGVPSPLPPPLIKPS